MNELVRLSGSRFFALRMQAARLLARRRFLLVVLARRGLYRLLQIATALARLALAPLVVLESGVADGEGCWPGADRTGGAAGGSALRVTRTDTVIGAPLPAGTATTS